MLSSLLRCSKPVSVEKKPEAKPISSPIRPSSSGPSRSFKNIYKDGNKAEDIEVPTPVLPVASNTAKMYKKRVSRKKSK
ncbi:uncharacterized protein [Blastocystis hominis]|uniref:Uncharacterized protein n=1 Tax=Blastocystis hominis TaxID=12968 RepID=D8MAQ8_BLAHO|nr:uncharacterized protein [Blastocystis hominis]CBK25147.2 unnamed protein product [Blastocystis hominis]|eukprot:XP_012899195.1 uncharacterized protein [Blastocystis hominis]